MKSDANRLADRPLVYIQWRAQYRGNSHTAYAPVPIPSARLSMEVYIRSSPIGNVNIYITLHATARAATTDSTHSVGIFIYDFCRPDILYRILENILIPTNIATFADTCNKKK